MLNRRRVFYRPSWSKLRGFGESRVLKSSYFWIAFVPLMAKIFRYINTIKIEFIKLDLELPFSWQMFFWGAFFASIANLIYAIKCPEIVKKFENYSEFEKSGRGNQQLLNEFALVYDKSNHFILDEFRREFCEEDDEYMATGSIPKLIIRQDCLKNAFWYVHEYSNNLEEGYRFLCMLSYSLGFCFFSFVLIQNIWFVISNPFFK